MKNLIPICCFLMLLCAASCSVSEDITCTNGLLDIAATGFTAADLDSVTVIRFKQDNAFDSTIDTSLHILVETNNTDTEDVVPHFIAPLPQSGTTTTSYFIAGYDYKIYLPKLTRWFTVTNITLAGNTHQHITHSRGDELAYSCTNKVTGCTINGIQVMPQSGVSADGGVAEVCISK